MKIIKLTKNKKAIIDDADFEQVSKNKWSFHHMGYAVRGKPQISMHRFIMNAKKGQFIDHKNHNKLDNRKNNLRFCTHSENIHNSLRDDGVHWRENRKAWIVRMRVDGKSKYIGYFKKLDDAKKARKEASIKYFGSFSPLI